MLLEGVPVVRLLCSRVRPWYGVEVKTDPSKALEFSFKTWPPRGKTAKSSIVRSSDSTATGDDSSSVEVLPAAMSIVPRILNIHVNTERDKEY